MRSAAGRRLLAFIPSSRAILCANQFSLSVRSIVTFDQLARVSASVAKTIVEAKMNFFSRFNIFAGLD